MERRWRWWHGNRDGDNDDNDYYEDDDDDGDDDDDDDMASQMLCGHRVQVGTSDYRNEELSL